MKRILFTIGISALIAAGCNPNSSEPAANDNKETKEGESKTAAATTLTDISASKEVKVLLAQNWENKDDAQEAALSGGRVAFDMPYRGFSFFSDGTVVQNPRDNIRFGTWTVDDAGETVSITYTDGGKAQYTIESITAKDMAMTGADKKKIEYAADGKVQKNLADDPFYGSNNQWRIKPKASESDEDIKKRLLACVSFYDKLLKDKVARGTTSPAVFVWLPPVFNWYDGSITVTGKDKLLDKWINCFYSKEQAFKAQAMLENIISKKYKWDKNEPNWLKKDGDVVKQIHDSLAAAK
ncbi:MAG: hypothetical protein ABUT20_55110 [Bacteroidota bacterium]